MRRVRICAPNVWAMIKANVDFTHYFMHCAPNTRLLQPPLYFKILSCSTLLQFARISIPLQAPVWKASTEPNHLGMEYSKNRRIYVKMFAVLMMQPNSKNLVNICICYLSIPSRTIEIVFPAYGLGPLTHSL